MGKQLGRVQRSMLDRPLQRVVDYLCRLVFCCVLFFLGCVLLGLASCDLPLVSFSASPPALTVPPNLAAAAAALSIFGRNLPAVLSVSPTVGRDEGIAMEMTCTERQLCILLSESYRNDSLTWIWDCSRYCPSDVASSLFSCSTHSSCSWITHRVDVHHIVPGPHFTFLRVTERDSNSDFILSLSSLT